MDLYVFVDNTCVEIFQIEKKKIDEINKYLEELKNDGINYEIRIARDTCFENVKMEGKIIKIVKKYKLLNCPFCNGEARIIKEFIKDIYDNSYSIHYVQCEDCYAKGPWTKAEIYTPDFEEIIDKWNGAKR